MIPGSNPQSKFKIIASYTALPGNCSSCGESAGPAIDTSLSFDYYGAVVFCGECARDLGRQAGLIDPGPDETIVVDYAADFRHEVEGYLSGIEDLAVGFRNYIGGLPDPGTESIPGTQDTCGGTVSAEKDNPSDTGSVGTTSSTAGAGSSFTVNEGSASLSSSAVGSFTL